METGTENRQARSWNCHAKMVWLTTCWNE